MEKQFIRVVFVTFFAICLESNAQLTSGGMVGDSFETSDGDSTRKIATTITHEYFKTEYMKKVENKSSYSPIVQNYSESNFFISKEKDVNEIHDKDYSGDVEVESTVSPMVLMGKELTFSPLTAHVQYFADREQTDTDAYGEDRATLKPSKSSEISEDLHSEVVTEFEFSGNLQPDTSADIERSDDLSQDFGFEMSGSTGSGEDYFFLPDLKGVSTSWELDLGARSTKQEFPSQRVKVEETKFSMSKYSSDGERLDLQDSSKRVTESEGVNVSNWVLPEQKLKSYSNVENNSYTTVVPKDADNYKNNASLGSGVMPTKFRNFRRRSRSTVSGVWNDDTIGKVTAKVLNMASAANRKRYYTPKLPNSLPSNRMSSRSAVNQKSYKSSQVAATMPFHRAFSVSAAKRENYKASKVPSTMASTFSREIDSGKILLSQNEVVLNAMPDNSLQDLYLQNIDKTTQKILGYSNLPEGRAATDLKKSSTSYASEYSRLDEHMDEGKKSKAVFVSTSPPKIKTSAQDYVLENGVEMLFNSNVTEPSASLFYPYQKVLLICSAICIPLLGVAIFIVIFIRGRPHTKNCCTRAGIYAVESRNEDSSIPLSEVIIHSRTDPPKMEHLVVDQERYNLWVPLNR